MLGKIDDHDPCMAALLARTRSDAEIFLLIAIFPIRTKSRTMRVFHRANLEQPSLKLSMRNAGVDVGRTLQKLVKDGYLIGGGPAGRYATTAAGNSIKHQFRRSRADFEMEGIPPSLTRSIRFIGELRRAVLRRCAEQDPEVAERLGAMASAGGPGEEE